MAKKGRSSDTSLYVAIEKQLRRKSPEYLTNVTLFHTPDVRAHAEDSAEVSDALGYMWRRGMIVRRVAPRLISDGARYEYTLAADRPPPQVERAKTPIQVPSGHSVEIELPGFVLTIKAK